MAKTDLPIANCFMIGAQKSGTTFLAALLDQSPDICVADPKEPRYFSKPELPPIEGYAQIFSDRQARIRLDASTTYSFLRPRHAMHVPDAPGLLVPVPERLRAHAGEPKLIYIMRDPVKRAISALRHHLRTQPQPKGPISLLAELERDPMVALIGRYADQIERYLETFSAEDMLFLDFDDLARDPQSVVNQTCAYLGVDPGVIDIDPNRSERHTAHRLTPIGRLLHKSHGLKRSVKAVLPEAVLPWVTNTLVKRPSQVSFTDQDAVVELYHAEMERVFALTGLKIGSMKT